MTLVPQRYMQMESPSQEKLLTNVVGVLACFVQKDTCLKLEQVSGLLPQVLSTYPGAYFLTTSQIRELILLVVMYTKSVFCVR
jgi:hypothetical protein